MSGNYEGGHANCNAKIEDLAEENAKLRADITKVIAADAEEVKELKIQIGELVAALQHMKVCGGCAEDSWEFCEGGREALAAVAKTTTPEKRKCPSTYSHSTHGKLTCEKDADHLNRVGDVEHYSRNVKWMSV